MIVIHGQVVVEQAKSLGLTGADRVQFVMDANRGQTKGPVDVVASSGEKSRLLLLLETRLPPPQARLSTELERRALDTDTELGGDSANAEDFVSSRVGLASTGDAVENEVTRASPCAVLYDEIDAHVGGRTAVAVGRLLANQGRKSQVSGRIIEVFSTIYSLLSSAAQKLSRDTACARKWLRYHFFAKENEQFACVCFM